MAEFFGLPPQDAELGIAVTILGSRSRVPYQVLDALVGEPMRFAELRARCRVRNDTTLTRALRRLRAEGVIDQRADFGSESMRYQLTALGKLVWARIQQMGPHHDSIDAYARGQAARA